MNKIKGKLVRNRYINQLNKKLKLKRFYSKGKSAEAGAPTIVFWSTGGMIIQSNLEGVIACALKLRGYNVHVVLCDGVYKACAKRIDFPEVPLKNWGKFCASCIKQNTKLFEKLGIEYSYVSDLIDEDKIEKLREQAEGVDFKNYFHLNLNGYELGSHLTSAMMRHTKGGPYDGLEKILKEYAFTVLMNAESAREVIKKISPTRIYMSHGIYADWGPALTVALSKNIPVTSYICCYLTAHFFFGTVRNQKETFLTISEESWKRYSSKNQSDEQKNRLQNFLERRYKNNVTQDLKGLLKEYRGNKEYFYKKLQLDPVKPTWGIMTHINWDAASDYFPMIHENFDEWLRETIKEIIEIPEVQWLIKIHPSELNDNPDTGCQKFIEKFFPDLPSHIKVLKMDDDISPLDFYSLLDGAITVMGTGGLELALKGKPVILAGEAHYSNKGFTFDAKSKEHYRELLHDAVKLESLDEEKLSLAWKYAYIYFIQKQIPLLPTIKEDLHIDFSLLEYLLPGKNKFMDFLCERIIDGEDFIIPEDLIEEIHLNEKDQIRNYA